MLQDRWNKSTSVPINICFKLVSTRYTLKEWKSNRSASDSFSSRLTAVLLVLVIVVSRADNDHRSYFPGLSLTVVIVFWMNIYYFRVYRRNIVLLSIVSCLFYDWILFVRTSILNNRFHFCVENEIFLYLNGFLHLVVYYTRLNFLN